MRRLWILCGALVFLSGCFYHASVAQNGAFVHKLVGYCAEVDEQVQVIKKSPANTQPGQIGRHS